MTLSITAAQRDALYDQIFDRLSGIGDVWLALSAEDYPSATRLGRAYSDDLRLVLDDLGWNGGSGESIELRTPPEVLRRALPRLRNAALELNAGRAEERVALREDEERNQLVVEACRQVLSELDETGGTTPATPVE